jgi:hypothetical protein
MLNNKCKSHRIRSAANRTDSLCIIEYDEKITRCFAKIISDKRQSTIVPIICIQVISGSTVHTDEHGAYHNLSSWYFVHGTVCHKYEFINHISGVHTQGIESFHNEFKLEIKRRKGVRICYREKFLKEFCFYFNHRSDFFDAVFDLIKV